MLPRLPFHSEVGHLFHCYMMDWMSGSGSGASNETSDDLTCAARSIQEPSAPLPYSRALVLVMKILFGFALYSTFIAGSFLNIFVFYLIIRYKKLHTLTFKISLQIVVLDLLQLYGIHIFRLVTVITDEWVFGTGMCIVSAFVLQCLTVARACIMCVFVIDRFLSIFTPYFYPRHSNKIAVTLSVIAWVFSVLSQLPLLPGLFDCFEYTSTLCAASSACGQLCGLYNWLFFSLVFIPTTLIPVVLYALLYWKVRKIKRDDIAVGGQSSGNSRKKRDWKTAITFFLLFLASFVLTTVTFSFILIFASLLRTIGPSPVVYVGLVISISVSTLIEVVDPIVIMRHSDVKEVLREIKTKLCGRCGLGQNQNQDRNQELDRVTPARSVQHLRAITVVQERVEQEQEQEQEKQL